MPKNQSSAQIAHAAARLVVEEGVGWTAAKRRALRQLGLGARTALPDNAQLEDAVRTHIAVFHAHTQPQQLHALRTLALQWMQRLAAFRPHLSGAVWHGTATNLSDIHLNLFCDDPKSAEIALINQRVRYRSGTARGFGGHNIAVLSIHARNPDVDIHLCIYDLADLRSAHAAGMRAGTLQALRRLLENL